MRRSVFFFFCLISVASSGQVVLYQAPPTPTALSIAAQEGAIYADDVVLAGSRLAGTLRIGVIDFQGMSVTSDVTAYLYAADDFGGFPGTELYRSTLTAQVFATLSTAVFENVGTFLPPRFYWGVQFQNMAPAGSGNLGPRLGVASAASPAGSTGDRHVWINGGGGFDAVTINDADSTFTVTIEEGPMDTVPSLDIAPALGISHLSAAGTNYLAQYTSNLVSGVWYDLEGPLTGTGNTIIFHDDSLDAEHREYRVVIP